MAKFEGGKMKVVCCICKETIQECKPGTEGDDRISHGMHDKCTEEFYGPKLPTNNEESKNGRE